MGVLRVRDAGAWKDLAFSGGNEVFIGPTDPGTNAGYELWYDNDAPDPPQVSQYGSRNVIRNGDMSIYQRGAGPFTTSGPFTLDGVQLYYTGGTTTVNRVPQAVGNGSALLQVQVTGQALASHSSGVWCAVEDATTLNGQMVTMSFDAFAASGAPKVDLCLEHSFGSGGSATTDTPVGYVTLSTTKTRYTKTFVMPSAVGKVLGPSHGIWVGFILSAGANHTATGPNVGLQNNTFSITDIQLEAGPSATPFERIPIQQQLAWCQRYFQRRGPSNPNVPEADSWLALAEGYATSSTQADVVTRHIVPMLTTPTIVAGGAMTNYLLHGATFNAPPSSLELYGISAYDTQIVVNGSGFAVGPAKLTQRGADLGGYLDYSAESF